MKRVKVFSSVLISIVLVTVLIIYLIKLDVSKNISPAAVSVQINEVMTSNKGSVPDGLGNYPDWIELYNSSNKDVDLAGYGLSDSLLDGAKYVFPSGAKLGPKEYVIVYCSGGSETPYHTSFKLSATEEIILFDTAGKSLDSIALRATAAGYSLALQSDGTWGELAPSPGYENSEAGIAAYAASQMESEHIGVTINEFMSSNATTLLDAAGEYCDWIELYNANDSDVDLSGFGISDSPSQPVKYQLPEGTVIKAKGYLIIYCSGNEGLVDGELHAPFGLRAYQEDVVFSSVAGKILDSYSYERQETDTSMARVPDGTGAFASTSQPTPGYPNTDAGYADFAKASKLPLSSVYISEFMGSNATTLKASDGSYYDWVELFNSSNAAVSLNGYGLSTNPNNPAKWVFPNISIDPGEYLVLYASGLNTAEQKKNLNLNFNVSAQGETLFLFDSQGKLVDKLSAGSFLPDVSYGRNSDDQRFYYTNSTPGAANATGYSGITQSPQFSVIPGIYDNGVEVDLLAGEGETVYYTTDCTTPTASSTRYTGKIPLSSNTVIRAVAMKDGYLTGQSVSGTYLFISDNVNHALPVVTLVTDPANLWDGKTGIYAYGDNFDADTTNITDMLVSSNFYEGKDSEADQAEWERDACFGVFDDSGKQTFTQNVGIRIAGSYGRSRAQKGFNIIARDEYGSNRMTYSFFDNRDYTEYKSLVLRAGAQDQNYSKIRDELACGLLEGTDAHVLLQAYKPYVLYLNGEYWGTYFLREKRSRFFVAQHEGLPDAVNMDIVKSSTRVTYGTANDWNELMAYVNSHDLSKAQAYDYVKSQTDLESFADYMISEIWAANTDTWNVQYYKLDGGKWKWIYYDFCWSLGQSGTDHQTLSYRRQTNKPMSDLFNALLKNSEWRDSFIRRFAYMMKNAYAPERVNALIDTLYADVQPEITREREKFNATYFMGVKQLPECVDKGFEAQIQKVRDFANGRNASMKAQLQSEFGLSDAYMQEVFGS